MDSEAASRGTTVYLVDKRIDMLPELLGTNLCSLRPFVERLAFSVIWVRPVSYLFHDVADSIGTHPRSRNCQCPIREISHCFQRGLYLRSRPAQEG
jgi:hypothetical protein